MQTIKMYCLGKSIDLEKIKTLFKKKKALKSKDCFGLALKGIKLDEFDEDFEFNPSQAFNVQNFADIKRHKSKDLKYIFVFPQAGVILWNFELKEE